MKLNYILLLVFSIFILNIFKVNSETFNEFEVHNVDEQLEGEEWKSPYQKREEARLAAQQDEMRRLTGYATTGKFMPSNANKCTGVRCPSGFTCNHEGVCVKPCGRVWCITSTECEKDLFGIQFCRPPRGKKKT